MLLVLISAVFSLDLLSVADVPFRRVLPFAGIVGLIVGEATWAMNYWQISAWAGGLLLLLIFSVGGIFALWPRVAAVFTALSLWIDCIRLLLRNLIDFLEKLFINIRMGKALQLFAFFHIAEYDIGQFFAVQFTVFLKDLFAEIIDDLRVAFRPRLHNLPRPGRGHGRRAGHGGQGRIRFSAGVSGTLGDP